MTAPARCHGLDFLASDQAPLPYEKTAIPSAGVNGSLISLVNAAQPYVREFVGPILVSEFATARAGLYSAKAANTTITVVGHGITAQAKLVDFELTPGPISVATIGMATGPAYIARLRVLLLAVDA